MPSLHDFHKHQHINLVGFYTLSFIMSLVPGFSITLKRNIRYKRVAIHLISHKHDAEKASSF